MSVVYEWDVEIVADGDTDEHEDGEVLDHRHQASFTDALADAAAEPEPGTRHVVVLVRDDDDGRSWAYLEKDGRLPEFFADAGGDDCARVPKRFHQEVAKATRRSA